MPVVGVAAVPTPPLQLPALAPNVPAEDAHAVASLRRASRDAIAGLPAADVLVVLAAGVGEVHTRATTSLARFGVGHVDVTLPVWGGATPHAPADADLLRSDDDLDVALSVLAALVAEVGRSEPVLPVTLAARLEAPAIRELADALIAVFPVGTSIAVVVAGDLASTLTDRSAGYLVEDAREVQARLVTAIRDQRPVDLAAVGDPGAARVGATGWAPLVAAQHLAISAGLRLRVQAETEVRGIGGLVASTVAP